ncbi:MAG: Holliday junction resolvase RuvX [Hormoscilla sp. GUM202]|nr:Holliday junction resolvase RuvX [Hormoscilla sp. GUM202]
MVIISALGLDIGKKRIGVAGCDGTGLIATGLTTISRTSRFFGPSAARTQVVASLRELVVERQVQVLVIGLPYTMKGSLGYQARLVQKEARSLGAALQLPVEYVDERLTSVEAEQLLIDQKLSPSRHKELIDRKAACLILQQWLDSHATRYAAGRKQGNLKLSQV